MLALYVIVLSLSSGLVGAFAQHVLTGLGYVPSFASGLWLTLGAASAYAAVELLWFGILRVAYPTRSAAAYLTESASLLSAIVLLPHLLGVPISGLPESIVRLEPLLYLGVFVCVHLFFKAASFYAHLQGRPDGVIEGAIIAATSIVCIGLAFWGATSWLSTAEAARAQALGEMMPRIAGNAVSEARVLPEGAEWSEAAPPDFTDGSVSYFWAVPPNVSDIDRLYFIATMTGYSEKVYEGYARFSEPGWVETQIPAESVPHNITRISVRWTREEEPNWQRLIGLRPIVYTSSDGETPSVWLSGPHWRAARESEAESPNVVLILLDGLSASRLQILGYEREVAPVLDKLAYSGLLYSNADAPEKGIERSIATILSGRRLAPPSGVDTPGLIAALRDNHYAIQGIVEEGNLPIDQMPVWMRDTDMTLAPPWNPEASGMGSAETFNEAREWIAEHRDVPFFLLVRIGALMHFDEHAYPVLFGEEDNLRDADQFDNALRYVDTRLGSVLKYIRDHETRRNTYVIVTSSTALRFSLGSGGTLNATTGDTVPIIISGPSVSSGRHAERVHLADLAATIADLTGAPAPAGSDGRNLLQ